MKGAIYNSFSKLYNLTPLPNLDINYFIVLKELIDIEKIQYYTRQELDKYQDYKLRKLIKHVYNNVRFYKNWFRENNLQINDFKGVKDLEKLPILTKPIIKENFNDFISIKSGQYNPKLLMTTGSTGLPFRFFVDRIAKLKENASIWRQWRLYNVKFRDRRAILRGTLVDEHGTKNRALWKYSFENKSLHLNTFHMNEENCIKIINKIFEYKPGIFQVYPMALFILAQYIKKYDVNLSFLKMVHFSSEGYTQIHREFIKKQFTCPILDRYGQSEIVLNAYECKPENGYHVEEENNILEVLDKNFKQVSEGETGRIVGTNLHNYSMPLIRYSTEDLAVMGGNECSCRRHSKKLKSIQGRVLDQIITEDKSLISGISFYHYWKHRISEKIPNLSFVQIIQPKIDEIIVRIFPTKLFSKKDEFLIIQELNKFVGNLDISFEYINEKPFGEKWRFTISKISDTEIKSLLK